MEDKKTIWYVGVNFLQFSDDTEVFSELENKGCYDIMLLEASHYDFSYDNDWDLQETFKASPTHYSGDTLIAEDDEHVIVRNDAIGGDYSIFRKVTEEELLEEIERQGDIMRRSISQKTSSNSLIQNSRQNESSVIVENG